MTKRLTAPWRVWIALTATMMITVPVVHFVYPVLIPWVDSRNWSINGLLPYSVEFAVRVMFDMVVLSALPMITGISCYHFLSFRRFRRGETYCGKCHGLLKDLTEPSCPNCGSAI